jgi:hypothetical protein
MGRRYGQLRDAEIITININNLKNKGKDYEYEEVLYNSSYGSGEDRFRYFASR